MRVDQTVADIRLLKLAELYEVAYERFVLEVAGRIVKDPQIRAQLMRLAGGPHGGDDHHARVVRALERLNAELPAGSQPSIELAAVQDVLECERAAREFYLQRVEHTHDPEVRQLFRDIAREEGHHIEIAQAALDLAQRRAHGIKGMHLLEYPSSLRGVNEDDAPPLREGVSDFGPSA